ncbi:hypothetical protein PoB_005790800 [Plakobranchus ocellatus]|uniref:Uncharacterized protein n=1 Tax=Plakobranchus ocellatus TaxID=259542 RepID=A0AAV4CHH5_9GAST|nr:hypothetical protein PoB_005790800 [Plakobranchus ocellatus]
MLPAHPHKDLVPPYGVNISALAFAWSGRSFAIASFCDTLSCRNVYLPWRGVGKVASESALRSASEITLFWTVYIQKPKLPWLRATLQELRTSSLICLP